MVQTSKDGMPKKAQDKLSKKNILKNINLKNMKKQLAMEYLSIKNSVM